MQLLDLLDEKELQQYVEWNTKHKPMCSAYMNDGAIGGRLTFCFTPTGLGMCTEIKCMCGETINVTNFEDW